MLTTTFRLFWLNGRFWLVRAAWDYIRNNHIKYWFGHFVWNVRYGGVQIALERWQTKNITLLEPILAAALMIPAFLLIEVEEPIPSIAGIALFVMWGLHTVVLFAVWRETRT